MLRPLRASPEMGSPVKLNVRTGGRVPIRAKRVPKFASPLDRAKGYEVAWQQVAPLFEAAREIEDVSFVYFIGEDGDDGPIKIGVAKDPVSRLRGMQTGNPRRLRIEQVLIGRCHLEKLLHELWEPFVIKSVRAQRTVGAAPGTEWFRADARPQLLPIIATAAAEQVSYLLQAEGEVGAETERIVRDAHVAHGFVAQGRDVSRTLARGAGYVVSGRPSRL